MFTMSGNDLPSLSIDTRSCSRHLVARYYLHHKAGKGFLYVLMRFEFLKSGVEKRAQRSAPMWPCSSLIHLGTDEARHVPSPLHFSLLWFPVWRGRRRKSRAGSKLFRCEMQETGKEYDITQPSSCLILRVCVHRENRDLTKKHLSILKYSRPEPNQNLNETEDAEMIVPSPPPSVGQRGKLNDFSRTIIERWVHCRLCLLREVPGRERSWRILSLQLQPREVSGREYCRLTRTIWEDKLRGGSNFSQFLPHTIQTDPRFKRFVGSEIPVPAPV